MKWNRYLVKRAGYQAMWALRLGGQKYAPKVADVQQDTHFQSRTPL